MLLKGHVDVVEQWALARQERARNLQTFGVPVLGFFLLLDCVERRIFLHLQNESDLSGITEIGHGQVADFQDEGFARQLQLVLALLDHVLQSECL